SCIYACPFGAPSINPRIGKAMTCDLCEGDPRCVMVCIPGALQFTKSERASLEKKRRIASQLIAPKKRSRTMEAR
ncbi:MAG: 4Fe-4S dicluster domain-containing protein, partial [Thermodesulfobacteriota bacterium]